MKNKSALSSTLFATLLIFMGCSEEVIQTDQNISSLDIESEEIETTFNKSIRVYDASGQYFVNLNFGSEKNELIEYDLNHTEYSIKFEYEALQRSETNISTEDQKKEIQEPSQDGEIIISYLDINLDPKAVGFYIESSPIVGNSETNARTTVGSYSYNIFHKSPGRWDYGRVDGDLKVNGIYPNILEEDLLVNWYYRNGKNGDFHFDFQEELGVFTTNGVLTSSDYEKPGRRKLGARVYFNYSSSNYSVYWAETVPSN